MLRCFHTKGILEAGLDEAGRGPLAGPVVAAAVILPKNFRHPLLNDSKKLNESTRDKLRIVIEKKAIAWAVASASPEEIDRINILQASFLAMHRAVEALVQVPEALLVDGNRFKPYPFTPHTCIIKGDGIFAAIAAASILAKTHRDEVMYGLHREHPHYGWDENKGYPTVQHRRQIKEHGHSPHHRLTFRSNMGFAADPDFAEEQIDLTRHAEPAGAQ